MWVFLLLRLFFSMFRSFVFLVLELFNVVVVDLFATTTPKYQIVLRAPRVLRGERLFSEPSMMHGTFH